MREENPGRHALSHLDNFNTVLHKGEEIAKGLEKSKRWECQGPLWVEYSDVLCTEGRKFPHE